jgi:WxcM-like, C-terminal
VSVDRCRLLDLPGDADARGSLGFVEGDRHVPFPIARIYYLYDVPAGQARGAHAHVALETVAMAIAGSFTYTVDDGRRRVGHRLDSPRKGLYVPAMLWRDVHDFSPGAVCLVLASARYDEADYIRDYAAFLAAVSRA